MKLEFARFPTIARAFSNRNFAIYTSGNSISLLGFWVHRVAAGWLAWELTGSGFWLGAIAFADLCPVVVLGPIAGALADRFDRRRVSVVCQILSLAQATALCALTAAGSISIEMLFALTLCLGVFGAVHQPARLSLVPSLVRTEDLSSAVAITSVIFNLARFVGPALSGVIITMGGIAPAFAFNALTYLASIAALLSLRLLPRVSAAGPPSGVFAEAAAGIRYAVRHPAIGPLLISSTLVSVLARPVFELLPGFAGAVFQRGPGGLAALTSAVGLGAIAGGLWLAQRGGLKGLVPIALGAVTLSGFTVAVFAVVGNFWLALAAMSVTGFAIVASGIATQTLIQSSVDDSMRGRVLALWGLIFRGVPALGALAMGWLSGFVGFGWPVAAGGIVCFLLGLWMFRRRERLIKELE